MKEWTAQAKEMGSIYANASITLALHSPQNSTEGFLWRMQVSKWLKISPGAATKGAIPSFWVQLPSLRSGAIQTALRNSNIVRKGWCLQELWLSPRILHIVEDQLLCKCPHSAVDIPGCPTTIGTGLSFKYTEASLDHWYSLIEGYSACRLTVLSDKLPAISGIHLQFPGRYVSGSHSGHLGIDIHNGLLWHRASTDQPLVRRPGRASSWSWASVDHEISYLTLQSDDKYTILPDSGSVAFDCSCNSKKARYNRFTCAKAHLVMEAVVGKGLKTGLPEKSKRFSFRSDELATVETLYFPSFHSQMGGNMVGWAIFDESPIPNEVSYVRISSVSRGGRDVGYCVRLVLKEKRELNYRRVGIGYIFQKRIMEALERQKVIIT